MSNSTIHKVDRPEKFKTINLKPIDEDHNLSWKAKGLLTYLLSRSDNWEFNKADLINRSDEGRTAVSNGLDELRDNGYLAITRAKDDSGQFIGADWWITDDPDKYPIPSEVRSNDPHYDLSTGNPNLGKDKVTETHDKQQKDLKHKSKDNNSSTTNVVESEDGKDENLKEMHQKPPDKDYNEWTKGDIVKNYFYWQYQVTDIPKQPSNWGQAKKLAGDLLDKFSVKTIDGAIQYFWRIKPSRFRDKFNTPIGDVHNIVSEYQEWAERKRKYHEKQKEKEEIEEKIEEEIEEEGLPEYKSVNLGGVLSGNGN